MTREVTQWSLLVPDLLGVHEFRQRVLTGAETDKGGSWFSGNGSRTV